jgi:ADP-ribosyl-[dinitrogen reductase] hydrolase
MILELGIGDAYGRPFEFNTPEFIKENNDLTGYKHRVGEEQNGIGIYTDDGQMSLAIAEQMLSELPGTQVRFATHFVTAYKRDPRGGYSKRIKNALEESKPNLPFELILKAKQAGANSNGSVMRAVPLGLLADPKEIMYRSIVQTSVTHGHIEAVNSATAISLTAHFFYHLFQRLGDTKPLHEKFIVYQQWMRSQMGVTFDDIYDSYDLLADMPLNQPLQCDAKTTASLSIKLAWGMKKDVIVHDMRTSAAKILKKAIDIGGDVDSSASIALGLYSLRPDAKMDLAQALYDNLENGAYGRDYMIALDAALVKKFPRLVKEENLTDMIV